MRFYRVSRILMMALLCVSTLSACSDQSRPEWLNTALGKPNRPYDNMILGNKHPPILNPKPGTLKGPAPSGVPSLENNPYDYFNALENPSTVTPSHPMPMPPESEMNVPPKKNGAGARKSFPVSVPYDNVNAAPVQVLPPLPVAETPVRRAEPKTAAYPDLSSVPYTPPELRAVKDERKKETQTLEQERARAERKKQALEQGEMLEEAAPAETTAPSQTAVMLGHVSSAAPAAGYADRMKTLQQTPVNTPAEY